MRLCRGFASPVVGNEWAPRVIYINHDGRIAQQRRRDRISDLGGYVAALPDGVRDVDNCTMYLI